MQSILEQPAKAALLRRTQALLAVILSPTLQLSVKCNTPYSVKVGSWLSALYNGSAAAATGVPGANPLLLRSSCGLPAV